MTNPRTGKLHDFYYSLVIVDKLYRTNDKLETDDDSLGYIRNTQPIVQYFQEQLKKGVVYKPLSDVKNGTRWWIGKRYYILTTPDSDGFHRFVVPA